MSYDLMIQGSSWSVGLSEHVDLVYKDVANSYYEVIGAFHSGSCGQSSGEHLDSNANGLMDI